MVNNEFLLAAIIAKKNFSASLYGQLIVAMMEKFKSLKTVP